ncbi:ATP-binding cassette domain-containing protein [Nevskia soli]|jgi:osmoprotectant transport system ATP-binding protein|uniref:ATP-binding cassette domain-containing protein n=1 Tax=Nevskia soli TaxID=418856 RepID=UPI0015D6B5BB|nr:ATP-binding cassette domain-containing protein [Nevskia soli]
MDEAAKALPIEFRRVSYSVAGRDVLKDISFRVPPGQTLVCLGRSGSGKTTALRLINGLLQPSCGSVLVGDRAVGEWDLIDLRRKTGYVIQEAGLFPHFTVERNVGLVPSLLRWPAEKIAARTRELLEQVDLRDFAGRYPRELSGGQRQRVGVARALAAGPGLMLLDEPFGALDPVTRLELQNRFLAIREQAQVTSVFVTHDIREALKVGNLIALLNQGSLEFFGTPDEFRRGTGEETKRFLEVLE